jgi:hypothetical protein
MTQSQAYPETHPCHHTQKIKTQLTEIIEHLRADVKKVDEPKAEALFETTAEVLQGLVIAYDHYEQNAEEAWES